MNTNVSKIIVSSVSDDMDNYDITIAEHRSYEHMIKIIEGLLK